MRSVLETCIPREELLNGTFNPEIFTAALRPVISHYRNGMVSNGNVYTDAEFFFKEATFPTEGLKKTLNEVFRRIAGDLTAPAIHRLETAFGGGKTHTLIAATHIAARGKAISDCLIGILEEQWIPNEGEVYVVGVAGDEISVHQPRGNELIPYTLWGEIAFQIGGEALYREVQSEAESYAAPGAYYLDKVFGNKKVLLMLDELAQYAARLEAARPDGASQLGAFLMSLHGYARQRAGISILITLAGTSDAFSKQTEQLTKLLSAIKGEEISQDAAIGIGERAVKGIVSVVQRDATVVTPVQASEISAVLAKRLFRKIDAEAAKETAAEYMDMYRKNSSSLPEEAISIGFEDRMIAMYPFHPTLIDFLNRKLAEAETFQGTRGVLRVLALAVRSIWEKRMDMPMIHVGHIDMRSSYVVNEIFGRTGSADLLVVLNSDVGGVDTGLLQAQASNAEILDHRNPHPDGVKLYECTWKAVFLHSLVGRSEGLHSKIFGLTESEALFAVSTPVMTPAQVRTALEAINENAHYLRYESGKYYAHLEPTINNVLSRIRSTISMEQIHDILKETAAKVVTSSNLFHIEQDVSLPEHLPDNKEKPILGVISLDAGTIDVEAMITTKGANRPRERQNLIFLLVPKTVKVRGYFEQAELMQIPGGKEYEAQQRIEYLAQQVKAMRMLNNSPQEYGVMPSKLQNSDFRERFKRLENDIVVAVSETYDSLYYPSTTGTIIKKEIKSAGGEGGAPILQRIQNLLVEDKELLTSDSGAIKDYRLLSSLFFMKSSYISMEDMKKSFLCIRNWPVLDSMATLERIIRGGVEKGAWIVYKMNNAEDTYPGEFYNMNKGIPMQVNLLTGGYSIITPQGAKQRGWMEEKKVEPTKIREAVYQAGIQGATTVQAIQNKVSEELVEISQEEVVEALRELAGHNKLYIYQGNPEQTDKPEQLVNGAAAMLYTPKADDVVVSPAVASVRGWLTNTSSEFFLEGKKGAEKVLPLLRRLGSLYNKGAKSTISTLDITDLALPGGASLRITLRDAKPETMKALGEFFEILDTVAKRGAETEAYICIPDTDDTCTVMKELK